MKVLVVGAGAVGLGITSCLLKANLKVDIVARETTVEALRNNGLIRTGIFSDYHHSPQSFDSYTNIVQVENNTYTHIIISSKAYDVDEIIIEIINSKLDITNTHFILFNNGWGTHLIAQKHLPKDKIHNARVITGFIRKEPNHVDITVHADSILIGSPFSSDSAKLSNLAEAISLGGIPCRTSRSISSHIWGKLIYNAALNPLGAILEVTYGDLASMKETTDVMNSIIEESFLIMDSYGIKNNWRSYLDYKDTFYTNLVPSTKDHRSSMLQDILAGKKTEIEFINGVIVKMGKDRNIETKTNQLIVNLIESKYKVVNRSI